MNSSKRAWLDAIAEQFGSKPITSQASRHLDGKRVTRKCALPVPRGSSAIRRPAIPLKFTERAGPFGALAYPWPNPAQAVFLAEHFPDSHSEVPFHYDDIAARDYAIIYDNIH